MTCINCQEEHAYNYCPSCGEKAQVKAITLSGILEDAFTSITNMDKGILYNLKQLTLDPRKLVTSYIAGKRKGVLNPVSFLIIAITLYLIIHSLGLGLGSKEVTGTDSKMKDVGIAVGRFIRQYFRFFWIVAAPLLALASKVFYPKYNYAEHMALASFVVAYATIVGIIGYVLYRPPLIFDPLIYITITLLLFRIYHKNNAVESFFRALLAVVLFAILLAFVLFSIGYIFYNS